MIVMSLMSLPVGALYAVAAFPLEMLLFPKDRFGQFGSANAMVRSIGTIVLSLVAGVFLDLMKRIYAGDEDYYRWMYIWAFVFQVVALGFMLKVYKYWKQYGGDKYYTPPSVSKVEDGQLKTQSL